MAFCFAVRICIKMFVLFIVYFDVKRREITLDTGVGARALLIRLYLELWTLGLACSSELCCAAFLSHFII